MDKIRSFIAIKLNDEVRAGLGVVIDKLKESGADVKWVKLENIHLTLKFLGSISAEEIEGVKAILDKAKDRFKKFSIDISKVGAFPKISFPKVVWAGVSENADILKQIYLFLEEELEKKGFQKEDRPFSPHLTIGRVKSPKNRPSLKSSIENLKDSSFKSLDVTEISLLQSKLTPQGPIYTPLHQIHLG